tara:strand:- start:50 stop:409 length:360 start_codon:yes stop_codon:yes gene_type:complete
MNLKSLAVSSVMAMSSVFVPTSVEARTPWIYATTSNGSSHYVKDIVHHDNGFSTFYADAIGGEYPSGKEAFKCSTGDHWYLPERKGPGELSWVRLGNYFPGTVAEAKYEVVCLGYRPSR